LTLALGAVPLPAVACKIALALAVDVSGSVDAREYRIQMQGLADALRDGAVADALIAAKARVLLVEWTGESRQKLVVPWVDIRTIADLRALAARIETAPRAWQHFSTAIGAALQFTTAKFSATPICARRVIDISGDGRSNEGIAPKGLRQGLRAAGFTVNALVIKGSEPDLAAYFLANVITGDAAFVVGANSYRDYPLKIRQKLLREVTVQISQAFPPLGVGHKNR